MALSDKNELLELELQECSNQLSCGTILITTLLRLVVEKYALDKPYHSRLCSKMSEEDFAILNSALTPAVSCDGGQVYSLSHSLSLSFTLSLSRSFSLSLILSLALSRSHSFSLSLC